MCETGFSTGRIFFLFLGGGLSCPGGLGRLWLPQKVSLSGSKLLITRNLFLVHKVESMTTPVSGSLGCAEEDQKEAWGGVGQTVE